MPLVTTLQAGLLMRRLADEIDVNLTKNISDFQRLMACRLKHSIFGRKNCFSPSKLQNKLRCAPCYNGPTAIVQVLHNYDNLIRVVPRHATVHPQLT